ncbi:fimbria/pilus periplasmic chaperone [Pseudomonas sp. CCM 7893]|uniref:Fimbria/pilus periplasmic chaperone n=1 Tax=Pseudomonas spelaei TaxID=1055469 RepID=A0A6I3WCG7_9PSED|nr:fimbria/pilus periplasmic chaperone [Pseudomonas spelaei]MUF07957.1 fimbria/pilus periplasmic chaperone [Pseudomonas spelaei]
MSYYLVLSALVVGITLTIPAQASIVLDNTRVVYEEKDREVTVKLNNSGSHPVVVQSWLDDGDVKKDPGLIKTPFMLMPPMTRVDPGKGQTLRLMYIGESLPNDHESLYYLNILEIPPKFSETEDSAYLQVALRTRIKVFYRPAKLESSVSDASNNLSWSVVQNGTSWSLQCSNPSPYYISMSEVSLIVSGRTIQVGDGMVSPRSKLNLALERQPAADAQVKVISIDDFGASRERTSLLNR